MDNAIFQNGATWLRVDFHLHTKSDDEFTYSGEDNFYNSAYVNALIAENIRVGVITNHNKFNFAEFKALKSTAKKKDVFLLPGVELSVNDGDNGIHTLAVFSDEWLADDKDRISPFITAMFPGKTVDEYQNGSGISDNNIFRTVEELDKTGLDYFLISAHVEEKSVFLKLGAFTFEAVKFALLDHENRLSEKLPKISHSHIRSVDFTGGILDGKSISFSPELNTLIGIRGSGKSSILEVLRYALDIRIDENDTDREYKRNLVDRTLGGGGKIVLHTLDRHGRIYQIHRILKEPANVFYEGKLQPGVLIQETVLRNPLFFGQKELAAVGKDSEKKLIEKLLGSKCDQIRRQIVDQKTLAAEAIDSLSKERNDAEQIEAQIKVKQDAEF
ncbi:MAG: hypothetical protein LBS84_05045, partial [Clostridiales bacterium]|nr:hypothetical protein [Clostridiales bacterium]